jgi:hypothetical protein
MWYLRASPARARAVLDRVDCFRISSRHKSSVNYWKPEEDKKLMEIYEQAVNERSDWAAFAASKLGGRTVRAVAKRIRLLRHGTPVYNQRRSNKRWSELEDSILREKLQQGLSLAETLQYLPGRSIDSIKHRTEVVFSITDTTTANRVRQKDFTDDQIQRAIHMRLKERKHLSEIATEFRFSLPTARRLWRYRCIPLLSEDVLDSIQLEGHWSHEESLHLRELYTQTELCVSDIALHFPSRTEGSVFSKISNLQLPFERRQREAALNNEASGLTPVATPMTRRRPRQILEGTGQRRMFSSSSSNETRLHEGKNLGEIATELGRPCNQTRMAWDKHYAPLLSKEPLRSIYAASPKSWSNSELQHLVDLCNQYQGKQDLKKLGLQSPGRTEAAVRRMRAEILHLLDMGKKLPKTGGPKHASSSQPRESSSPRGLQPTRPNLSMPKSVESSISRRAFSLSSRASFKPKVEWTAEDDQKILSLDRQGWLVPRIAISLGGPFTAPQVSRRLSLLKSPRQSVTSKQLRWSAEEDAILIQGKQEGLRFEDIAAQLPGRSRDATCLRWSVRMMPRAEDSRQSEPRPSKARRKWTDGELQRLIEMRVNERRALLDIAASLGRSSDAVKKAWSKFCVPRLSSDTLQEIWNYRHWSVQEQARLIQLHDQGFSKKDIRLQFPSRSATSIYWEVRQLRPRFAVSSRQGSRVLTKFDWIALKTALEPYLGKRRTDWTLVNAAFPQFSRSQIYTLANRMRRKRKTEAETEQSDDESVRTKDEEQKDWSSTTG